MDCGGADHDCPVRCDLDDTIRGGFEMKKFKRKKDMIAAWLFNVEGRRRHRHKIRWQQKQGRDIYPLFR